MRRRPPTLGLQALRTDPRELRPSARLGERQPRSSFAGSRPERPGRTLARHEALDLDGDALNPRYSFDQFIIGDGNRLAHAAALAVAELPGQAYNPLFLHAPPGLGKTHLLHAIGNYVRAFGGGAAVRYTTVEAFTNHFISALGSRSLDRFKHAYRDADVLLIDDVQFLASKAKTEEEFFHTFNALYETGRQLVLTCDRLPRQLVAVEERLRERFESGLVADIRPPDLATRVAILRKRAALDRIQIADDAVLDLIAERVTDNVRALEGALIRVVAYHSLTQRPIDVSLASGSSTRSIRGCDRRPRHRSRTSRRVAAGTTGSRLPSSSPPAARLGSAGRARSRSTSRASSPTHRSTTSARPSAAATTPPSSTPASASRNVSATINKLLTNSPSSRPWSAAALPTASLTHLPVPSTRQLSRSLRPNRAVLHSFYPL